MTWWQAGLAYIVGPTIMFLGTWAAARVTARGSTQAASKTAEVEEKSVEVEGLSALVDRLEKRLAATDARADRLEKRTDELEGEVRTLKEQRSRDKSLIRYLIDYARALIRELQNEGLAVPDPPGGIDIEDPSFVV